MKTQIKHDENRISSNFKNSLRGQDSNLRPFGYEPNELPTALPRDLGIKNRLVINDVNSYTKYYSQFLLQY